MALILAVPQQNRDPVNPAELCLGGAGEWLTQAPPFDANSAGRIYDVLHKANRTAFSPKTRLQQMELYRSPVASIGAQLEKRVSGSFLPLTRTGQNFVKICRDLTQEMTYGYKLALLDLAIQKRRHDHHLGAAIHGAIRYLTVGLYESAICYSNAPPGTWNELHSLYIYAMNRGIENSPIKDSLRLRDPQTTISRAYRHALLFGLINIYSNPVPMVRRIYDYLERWADHAGIARFPLPDAGRGRFVIDPNEDFPPRLYSPDKKLRRPRRLLMLDTNAMTRLAHDEWKRLRSGASPESMGVAGGDTDSLGLEALERVITSLTNAPRRRHPRTPSSKPYELAIGFEAASYFLEGNRRFGGARGDSAGHPMSGAGKSDRQRMSTGEQRYATQSWVALNESTCGVCLHVDLNRSRTARVRVGEVVVMRACDDESVYTCGIIRWVRTDVAHLNIGIQKLGAGALPVALRPAQPGGPAEERSRPGVMLPAGAEIERRRSLITPAGVFHSGREYSLDDGNVRVTIYAEGLIERNHYFEWFEYTIGDG